MENKLTLVKIPLQAHARFHFGEFKADENIALGSTSTIAHSDMLFAALVNSYAEKYDNVDDDFVALFKEDKIKISSLFYYLEKEINHKKHSIYLLPTPVFLDIYSPQDPYHKKRNRIQFISFNAWQQGLNPSEWIGSNGIVSNAYALIQNGEVLLTKDEFEKFDLETETTVFYKADHPNSPIRKEDPKQSIFYEADVHIAPIKDVTIGCYFFYQADKESLIKLKKAVNILRYAGIGGNRTTMGRTMLQPIFDEELTFKGDQHISISLINPIDKNDLATILYYKTSIRGGSSYVNATAPNQVVRMIREGALVSQHTKGQLVKIGTDQQGFDVLRYGKAFTILSNLPKNNKNE